MTCLFLYGVPKKVRKHLKLEALKQLYTAVSTAADIPVSAVQVHFAPFGFTLVQPDGISVKPVRHGVHTFIEWSAGRTLQQKEQIAAAIQAFLDSHEVGQGSDITFRDSPRESFFLEGKLVGQKKAAPKRKK